MESDASRYLQTLPSLGIYIPPQHETDSQYVLNPKLSVFSLPRKVRLEIYGLALKGMPNNYSSDQIMIGLSQQPRPSSPALLRTCRAIYLEAAPVLYEINTFQFSYPGAALRWLNTIGAINTAFLRGLRIFVEATVGPSSADDWYMMFSKLGREARGLRQLHIYLDRLDDDDLISFHPGLGRSEKFVRGLSSIKSLECLEVGGFFWEAWPEYLRKTMGVTVVRI